MWARVTLSDRFYTPTLIRPDNEREGWDVSQIGFDGAAALASAMLASVPLALARRQRRREMIEFLAQMPTGTIILLTMAVLGLAATLIVLRRLI